MNGHRFALPAGGSLTPEQVRGVAFHKPPLGKRGYNEDEVDAFLDLVESELRNPTGHTLTPDQVHNAAFSMPVLGKRGYHQDEVDAFLDLVEQQLRTQRGAQPPSPRVAFPPPPIGGMPTSHAAGPYTRGRRIIDAAGAVFGSFWFWFLLGFVLLAGGGVGLRFLGQFIPLDLNGPAPTWVGPLFLATPPVLIVVYLVVQWRSRGKRRHRYWTTGGDGGGGEDAGCSGGGCGGGGCGGGGH